MKTLQLVPNPRHNNYICMFNAMYHDAYMDDEEIIARIGQEPPTHILEWVEHYPDETPAGVNVCAADGGLDDVVRSMRFERGEWGDW